MKEKIVFCNNSMILEYYNPINREYTSEEIQIGKIEDFYGLFDCLVEFDKELTVEGFLKNLRPYVNVLEVNLRPFIGNFDLKSFFNLLDKPREVSTDDDLDDKVSHVEMYWSCEIWESSLIDKTESEFVLWGSYHGISKDETINYSFGLTPLNNWKHYNFILNSKLECFRNTEKLTKELVFVSDMKWTLYDILKNFFYELTFYGSLNDMESFKNELEEKLTTFKKLDNPFKKFEIEILEEELEKAIQDEEYESAAKIKSKIEELKKDNTQSS